jgi:hypothetical protein
VRSPEAVAKRKRKRAERRPFLGKHHGHLALNGASFPLITATYRGRLFRRMITERRWCPRPGQGGTAGIRTAPGVCAAAERRLIHVQEGLRFVKYSFELADGGIPTTEQLPPLVRTADKAGGHSNALTVRWDRLLFERVKREIREIARKMSWR